MPTGGTYAPRSTQSPGTTTPPGPSIPSSSSDDLTALACLGPESRLLEIGCGPGKATIPLARRDFEILALELGADMAAEARRRLAPWPRVQVHNSSFESFDQSEAGVDLVYAATAWHWVDPAIRYAKASDVLVPRGYLAFWGAHHAFPSDTDPFFEAIQPAYSSIFADAHGSGEPTPWPPPRPEDVPDSAAEIEASGLFDVVGIRRYVWEHSYTV